MVDAVAARAPALVLGTAQLRGTYGAVGRPATARSDNEVDRFLRHAVDLGFSVADTAPAYGDSETLIGRSGLDLTVHTKIDPALDPVDSLTRSLQRLNRSRVEVLYFHDPRIVTHDPRRLIDRARMLVGDRVGSLGASVYSAHELVAVIDDARFGSVQVPMNLLDRHIDDATISHACERGLQVFVRSVFLQGVLLTPPERIPERLSALVPYVDSVWTLARHVGISVTQLALGWVRSRPGVAGVVVGANTGRELESLAEAWAAPPLDEDALRRCAALTVPSSEACDPRSWG